MLWARLAGKALQTRLVDHRPMVLSHFITGRCNADCRTCLWKMPADARANEPTNAQAEALYQDAAAAGLRALVLWGGENRCCAAVEGPTRYSVPPVWHSHPFE